MANNYYGFTHAGTQYGSTYTPVASVATAGYPMPAQMYGTSGRTGYEQAYAQTTQANSASTFSYTNRTQPNTAAVGFADSGQYQASGQNAAYPYGSGAGYTNSYNSVVTNYAATALYSQQTTATTEDQTSAIYSNNKPSNWNFKKQLKGNKPKTTKSVQQLHYCEVCKISCAGPQTYKEHLEGQRHKKKEAQLKSGNNVPAKKHGPSMGGVSLRCELCDVTCTGNDAYAAHIRGAKHQKVVKLHTKLGKPIPSTDPVVISSNIAKASTTKTTGVVAAGAAQPASASKIKVLGTPRINFVGGGRLHTTGSADYKDETTTENLTPGAQTTQEFSASETVSLMELEKSDAQPVGQDYIDEIKGDDQKVVSFHCKLCDCRFNDPNAKEMHLKGRRHRLQYKKKVDPNLVVDVKPSLKHRKMTDMKDRRFNYKRDIQYWNDWYGPNTNRYYESRPIGPPMPPMPPPPHMPPIPPPGFAPGFMGSPVPPPYRRGSNSNSWDDIHIMQKHSEICPKEEELDEIHHLVSCVERALKLVSDKIAEEDTTTAMNDMIKREFDDVSAPDNTQTAPKEQNSEKPVAKEGESKPEESTYRQMKGLMRVGPLAKGLLLTGDKEVELVVICAEKPTKHLLQRIVDLLPSQLQVVSSSESFDIVMKVHESGLSISSKSEPCITANVVLTSPLVREENLSEGAAQPEVLEMAKEPKQLLDRQKCVDSLAALRHAKWFQARVANLQPCPLVIRLFRDLCKRLPTWSKLSLWAVELLTEKVISSAGEPLAPGEALRHTFEAIASGILLPGGNGLMDPCEKEPTDALASLTRQEREDITASAQHALRLIAFRQIYKILGVDPLPNKNRKRRYDSENGTAMDSESVEPKKDKTEPSVANSAADGLAAECGN